MRHVFVCPMDDTIEIAAVDMLSDNRIRGGLIYDTFVPQQAPLYPFVPAYFQDYNHQRGPLRDFLREHTYGLKPHNYLLALHDDATDLEAHALSELLIACGARETLVEYRAFLLSAAPEYIALTGSKRAVTVTLVCSEQADTERIFIPVNEASPEAVTEAIRDLDPAGRLPVCRFGVHESLFDLGKMVHATEVVRNFVKLL